VISGTDPQYVCRRRGSTAPTDKPATRRGWAIFRSFPVLGAVDTRVWRRIVRPQLTGRRIYSRSALFLLEHSAFVRPRWSAVRMPRHNGCGTCTQ